MKVLFVEDENVKQSNIVTYLKDELGVENISVVNSLMGGMLALRNGKFDIVLLDMSLPLYDINGEDEELNDANFNIESDSLYRRKQCNPDRIFN